MRTKGMDMRMALSTPHPRLITLTHRTITTHRTAATMLTKIITTHRQSLKTHHVYDSFCTDRECGRNGNGSQPGLLMMNLADYKMLCKPCYQWY